MPFLKRTERESQQANQLEKAPSPTAGAGQKVTFLAVYLGLVASIGGFMYVDNDRTLSSHCVLTTSPQVRLCLWTDLRFLPNGGLCSTLR